MTTEAQPPVTVLGGAGFIGSHLVDRLLAEHRFVDVVDDYSTGSLSNLAAARSVADGNLKVHQLDVRDEVLAELVERRRPSTIFHCAMLAPGEAETAAAGTAVTGLLNVLETVRRARGIKLVVCLPGVPLFGDVSARDLPIKEGRPYTPTTVVGVIARTVLDLLNVYRDHYGVEFTALVMSNIYGSRQRPADGVVASLLDQWRQGQPLVLNGDGRQTRDFLYVDDAVDAVVRAASRADGLTVNVATGEQTSIRDLAHLITGGPTVFGPARRHDVGRFALSPVRARIHLQWSAWTTIRDGITALTRP